MSDSNEEMTTWAVQTGGIRGLPYRFSFTIASFSRPLWWSIVVVIPVSLLTMVVFFDSALVESYALFCAGMAMVVSGTSERFTDTIVELDRDAGDVILTYRMSDPSIVRSPQDKVVSLEDVESARFRSVAGKTMVLLYKQKAFFEGTPLIVPPTEERHLRDFLRRHEVVIRGEKKRNLTGWVWVRCSVTALFLVVIPLGAMIVWPIAYSWPTLVVLALHSVLLPKQGW